MPLVVSIPDSPIVSTVGPPSVVVRKSSRTSKPPVCMNDYITQKHGNANCCYPISQVVGHNQVSSSFNTALSSY